MSLAHPFGAAMLASVAGNPLGLSNTQNDSTKGASSGRGVMNEIFKRMASYHCHVANCQFDSLGLRAVAPTDSASFEPVKNILGVCFDSCWSICCIALVPPNEVLENRLSTRRAVPNFNSLDGVLKCFF